MTPENTYVYTNAKGWVNRQCRICRAKRSNPENRKGGKYYGRYNRKEKMIKIEELTEADKGREVRYKTFGKTEYGHITSWNDKFIFVRYHTAVHDNSLKRQQRTGTTSESTRPEDLEWA